MVKKATEKGSTAPTMNRDFSLCLDSTFRMIPLSINFLPWRGTSGASEMVSNQDIFKLSLNHLARQMQKMGLCVGNSLPADNSDSGHYQ
jgi:hypothetical protein